MANETDILFEVMTPLGFRVRLTQAYWNLIIDVKHPVMAGREDDVRKALEDPDEIRKSKSDENVYLFYRAEREKRWLCAVSKQTGEEGFLITTYPQMRSRKEYRYGTDKSLLRPRGEYAYGLVWQSCR